jgi:hypothetical protein
MIKEEKIVELVRSYLENRGYVIKNKNKKNNEHGCDIITENHKKWRKNYYIEAKGEGKAMVQTKYNAFWTLFGQILERMDIQGNDKNKGRIYAIAIPANWENTFKRKIKNMEYGWKLLKLKVFLVSDDDVKEKSYSYFLKK